MSLTRLAIAFLVGSASAAVIMELTAWLHPLVVLLIAVTYAAILTNVYINYVTKEKN